MSSDESGYHLAMTQLIGLSYSPWSEKAKWALEVRKVPYRFRPYQPLLGEPALRRLTGRWRGNVTVPVLVSDQGEVLDDSAKIARWADARGEGPALFPAEHERTIARWIETGERALEAGRVISLHRTLESPAALKELVPRPLRSLGGLAAAIGGLGVRRTLRKYGAGRHTLVEHRRVARDALDELRAAIARSPSKATPKTILEHFSFADVAASQILTFVSPPAFGVRLGPESRKGFTDPELATEYADLIAWRDALYEAHRPRNVSGR